MMTTTMMTGHQRRQCHRHHSHHHFVETITCTTKTSAHTTAAPFKTLTNQATQWTSPVSKIQTQHGIAKKLVPSANVVMMVFHAKIIVNFTRKKKDLNVSQRKSARCQTFKG